MPSAAVITPSEIAKELPRENETEPESPYNWARQARKNAPTAQRVIKQQEEMKKARRRSRTPTKRAKRK